MRRRLLEALPLVTGFGALLVVMGWTWARKDYYSGGVFTYALDDAYIHMALAKNLAQHGVFGATRFEFASASSSPLWTLLLALVFKIVGVREYIPLVMTILASAGLVMLADRILRWYEVGVLARVLTLPWMVGAAPLVAIIFGGMEHPLQLLIDTSFVYVAIRLVQQPEQRWDRLAFGGLALAAATTGIRYEGAVLVAVVAVLTAIRGRWSLATALACAGAAPIVAWGVFSLSQGGFFLPNSVLVKSQESLLQLAISGGAVAYADRLRSTLTTAYPVYLSLAAAGALLLVQMRRGVSKWHPTVLIGCIAVTVAIVHLLVGQVGWFFRYEDYMIVLLCLAVVVQLVHALRVGVIVFRPSAMTAAVVVLVLLAGASGVWRGVSAVRSTPRAMENIYEQMYQTAHFLKENPQYDSVAVGDLGAVSYFNDDIQILDLEGLAETGVPLEVLGRDNITEEALAELAAEDECDIAVVFPDYFDLPDDWVEVAYWRISNNIVAYTDTVVFVAIPPTDPEELKDAVQEYAAEELPDTVEAGEIVTVNSDE